MANKVKEIKKSLAALDGQIEDIEAQKKALTEKLKKEEKKFDKDVVKVLTRARDLIENSGWTRFTLARDKNSKDVEVSSDRACRFCSIGALRKAAMETKCDTAVSDEAQRRLKDAMGLGGPQDQKSSYSYVVDINDSTGTKKEHVLMSFDFAILGAGR